MTHGLSSHPLYRKWAGMITRTTNKKESHYKNYGGRGIVVCEEWKNNFMDFYEWSVENGWKQGLTIDRINVNGNYEPKNCQWITMSENTMKDKNSTYIINSKQKEICDLYKNTHITVTKIAKMFGTYKNIVSIILKENNIQIEHRRMKKC